MKYGFKCEGDTCRFSKEVVDQVSIPVLADYILGMCAVADLDIAKDSFEENFEALNEYGYFTREKFLENNAEYFHSMSDLTSHFDAAMIIVQAEISAMETDEEFTDFLAERFRRVEEFFPKWIADENAANKTS